MAQIRLLLAEQVHQLIVDLDVLHHVHEHIGAVLDDEFLIVELRGVSLHDHVRLVRFVDDGDCRFRRQFRIRAAPVVVPEFQPLDLPICKLADCRARFAWRRDFVDDVELVCCDAQDLVGTTVGRGEAR